MRKTLIELESIFNEIKGEYIKSFGRNGTTGIGYTFEKILNKDEDSSFSPDYKEFELKTKTIGSKTPMTLFTLRPLCLFDDYAINYLIERYGSYDTDKKKLYLNISTLNYSKTKSRKYFKLKVDYERELIRLIILDNNFNCIDCSVYWPFNEIVNRLENKLSYLAFVKGNKKEINKEVYYIYESINFYILKDKYNLIRLIDEGKIIISLNIEKKYGEEKANDRGSAFRIEEKNIPELFYEIIT